ncbi:MAG: glycerol kinase GlpK [Bacteroidota bacterium]|nr:glycerol kinase GlpK [Bacteroidota bacterium]
MGKYMLSLDQGTTSSRALVFDSKGKIKAIAQKEFRQIFPKPGWVEHDGADIWESQLEVARKAIKKAGLTASDIAGIGITNQRETTLVWDRKTGKAVCNAIVWQDRRTSAYCNELKAAGHAGMIQKKTGLIIDAYFSATKLKWILDTHKGLRKKAEKGGLCFGTVDSWLLFQLTNREVHATDVSNASRTMLYNIHTLNWDEDLLSLFDILASMLPEVKSSSEIYGYTSLLGVKSRIPVCGMAGDQQAALFGQMAIRPGIVKNTYGTGCFMLMNTGEVPVLSKNSLLTTIAWKLGDKVTYALEGGVFIGGAVVQWLRDGLKIIKNSKEVESLAASVPDNGGVYFVPAFAGLGAPYWNQFARGTLLGITRGTTSAHLARASLESIAFQTMDVLHAMNADASILIRELRVDGGATVNDLLMQFQSDVLDKKVIRPKITETTAAGAAFLAGLAIGFWKGIDEIEKFWEPEKFFKPTMKKTEREATISNWRKAIHAAQAWTEKD